MTLERAIEELNSLELPIRTELDHKKHLAVRLGIEALKRVKECGYPARCGLMERLPGETNS